MEAKDFVKNCWAVVPAAGVGRRMLADRPKQYLQLFEQTVLEQTLLRLRGSGIFQKIVVSVSADDGYWSSLPITKKQWLIRANGGEQRADSVLSGLNVLDDLADPEDWVFVHDAARPCLTHSDLFKLRTCIENDSVGGILALPVHDTLKRSAQDKILETLDRRTVWRALTPQAFRLGVLKQALLDASTKGVLVTDEASAIEAMGLQPMLVEGRADNIKITRPEDLALARFYLEQQ
ncbi:MAG TPA: 2-C-methyl-D-erythritol 4-phosphate cytidylyltransferase [Crenotrichaceae bacterium]|nr:2-C-methyl-D-erythritol 4-phosphate cytidylyltransferase [Crenotrichaceae bacterium]